MGSVSHSKSSGGSMRDFQLLDIFELLKFQTAKKVTICDWRVGLVHKVLCLGITFYFVVVRIALRGDHLKATPLTTHVSAQIEDAMTDEQWKFEPSPPRSCDIRNDATLGTIHPQDLVYELLSAKNMFFQQSYGEYFIPSRFWSMSDKDTMNRTYSEGHSALVCAAACKVRNLTSSDDDCADKRTASACRSSFATRLTARNELKVIECLWESTEGKCARSPYWVDCSSSCGFSGYCDGSASAARSPAPSSDCQIYESPVEYIPQSVIGRKRDTGEERIVGSPERLIIEYQHILLLPGQQQQVGNMEGYMLQRHQGSWLEQKERSWSRSVKKIPVSTCVNRNNANLHLASYERDGRIQRCFQQDSQPRTVDFLPLTALVELAGKSLSCDENGISILRGFTLVVDIEYSNLRQWAIFGSDDWYSVMRVHHETWLGEMENVPFSKSASKLEGQANYARGVRILFRTHGTYHSFRAAAFFALIPEYFAFLAIVEFLIVKGLISYFIISMRASCGSRKSRLATKWYMGYIYERTPDIAKLMGLIHKIHSRSKQEVVTLTSEELEGDSGLEFDHHARITRVDEDSLAYNMLNDWNDEHPVLAVGPGDKLLKVNGKTSIEEMRAELGKSQAFLVEIEPCADYPHVMSRECMRRLRGDHNFSIFDTTRPALMPSFLILEQLKRFYSLASNEVEQRHSSRDISLEHHDDHTAQEMVSPRMSLCAIGPAVREGTTASSEKLNQMEGALQELGGKVADLLAWRDSKERLHQGSQGGLEQREIGSASLQGESRFDKLENVRARQALGIEQHRGKELVPVKLDSLKAIDARTAELEERMVDYAVKMKTMMDSTAYQKQLQLAPGGDSQQNSTYLILRGLDARVESLQSEVNAIKDREELRPSYNIKHNGGETERENGERIGLAIELSERLAKVEEEQRIADIVMWRLREEVGAFAQTMKEVLSTMKVNSLGADDHGAPHRSEQV